MAKEEIFQEVDQLKEVLHKSVKTIFAINVQIKSMYQKMEEKYSGKGAVASDSSS